jgi:hypothetical protein
MQLILQPVNNITLNAVQPYSRIHSIVFRNLFLADRFFFKRQTIWYVALSSDYGCRIILNDYHGKELKEVLRCGSNNNHCRWNNIPIFSFKIPNGILFAKLDKTLAQVGLDYYQLPTNQRT